MGMAASQARLLMITARIHDVEFEAQSIQNAKLRLATQEDQVYREYQEALDATTLTFTSINNGYQSTLVANFNNLFSMNRAQTANGKDYVLISSKNKVVVDQDLYEGYYDYIRSGAEESAFMFAMYMLGDGDFDPENIEMCENSMVDIVDDDDLLDAYYAILSTLNSRNITEDDLGDPDVIVDIYDTSNIDGDPEAMDAYKEALSKYQRLLYKNHAAEMYEEMCDVEECDGTAEDFDKDMFDYYMEMFTVIQSHGGCEPISKYNGFAGNASTNSEWLTNMIQSGQMSIESMSLDRNYNVTIDGVGVSSDTDLKYTTTTDIDKKALAKAEAEYEHKLKLIDKKDKQYDLSLSRLETERNALTTEYDSVKKVISDNIERTFGIFS